MPIPKFKNEPVVDFSKPAIRKKQLAAIAKVRSELGREYPIGVGTERIVLDQKFHSTNPSNPSEIVGTFQRGNADVAVRAMEVAVATFDVWKRVPYRKRAEYLLKAAALMRKRRFELNRPRDPRTEQDRPRDPA